MSQVCCVEDCNHSRSKNKCTLKRFPSDTHKCKLWEDIIKRDGWERTSWDRICECHFSDEQFEQNRADGLRKLRWDAVPTLFGSNLRILTKASAEDVAERKDSEEGVEDNDELEELEVEIEENSNSDECSDVETYIITGDLNKSIQVIKEKESPSTTRSNEKQLSESLPTGKSKTKRIVIRVPSSVGDCKPVMTDGGGDDVDEDQSGGEERIEDNIQKGEETPDLHVEESNLTETPSEENIDCRLGEDVSEKQWNVESSSKGELAVEDSKECDPVENAEESVNLGDESTAVTNLEENEGQTAEAGGDETVMTREDITRDEMIAEISEFQALEDQPEDTATATADYVEEATSTDNQVTTSLTDTDLSQLKSDWKNPKLQARDVKLMTIGGSSKMYKKKHQLFQSKASHVSDDAKMFEETAETRLPVAENLENVDFQETQEADEERVAETGYQELRICDERLPEDAPTCERQEPSEIQTSERLEPVYEDFAPEVQEPCAPEVQESCASEVQESCAPEDQESCAPEDQESCAPEDQESCAPEDQEAYAPDVQESCAPENQEACAPEDREAYAPEVQESCAPEDQEACAPEDQESCAPEVQESCAPEDQESCAPEDQEAYAPDVQESCAPENQETCAPEDGEAYAPEVQGSCAPEDQEACAPEVQESCAPEVQEAFAPEVQEAYLSEVSKPCVQDGVTEVDVVTVSIEEKLEKIFSEGENSEKANAEVESSENLHELTSNDEPRIASEENENVVRNVEEMATQDQQEEVENEQTACVEETESNGAPAEKSVDDAVPSAEVSCDVGVAQEKDTSLVIISEEEKGQIKDSIVTDDSLKDTARKSDIEWKKSPKKRKEAFKESGATAESNGTEEIGVASKGQESRKIRGSRDSVDENRRGSSSSKNHKESGRRADKEKTSPEKSRQHNSHSSREEKVGVSKRKTEADAKKSSDDEKRRSPTKETRQSRTSDSEKSNAKTREQPKELRSSKRCLISTAPTRRRVQIKEEMVEEESEDDVEDEKPVSKRSKMIEGAVNPVQTKRRGRPPRSRESVSEKAVLEESKSLRYSKRTPKPSEKYKDSRVSQVSSVEEEQPRRIFKRKFSSEDEDDGGRRIGRGGRPLKRRSTRCASLAVRRRHDVKNIPEEEEEEEEQEEETGNAQSMCRVCGTEQQILLSIFGPEGSQLRLEDKIHSHLPIRVRQNDKLPLGVCHSCVVTLSACDSLVDKCTQVDKKLRKIFNCPPDETIEEDSDPGTERREKSRPPTTERASGPSQVAAKRVAAEQQSSQPNKEVAVEKTPEHPVEPTAPMAAAVPAAPELSAKPTAPVQITTVVSTAPVVQTTPVIQIAPVVQTVPVEPQQVGCAVMEQEVEAVADVTPAPQMVVVDQLAEAVQHDAILVKKEEYDSDMVSPMKRFGNTYSTGRRTSSRIIDTVDPVQDRNSVIVIPPTETVRPNNDVPPHSEEYILSMDEPPDDTPKTVVDSILDDWDEEEQDRASTSAANSRVLTIKNPPDSEIVVTRLYNDEEEILAEGESGEIIIQIQEFSGETREQPFWPAPDPAEETIIPDTDEQQNLTWKCGECGLRGKSVGAFLEHKKSHQVQEKKLFCTLCNQSFTTVEMLALHKKEMHYEEDDEEDEDEEDEGGMKKPKSLVPLDIEEGGFYPGGNCKLYKCDQCDKMFGAAWSWKKHMEAHELDSSLAENRVHKCEVCNGVFFDKTTFEDHKLTHMEGETSFQCSICDAKFATWNVFLAHVHTHKSSKTICKKCGRDFGDVKVLRDHMKEVHPTSNEKKFACHLCDKVCRKKIALTEHIRKHTGEMPFECEVCHKRFSRLANYRAHAAIHENQRRFACDVCGKRFNRQSIQQRHMKTHMRDTIKTSHVCRVCGEAFNKVNELLEHRLNHTRDDVERAYWMDVKLRGDTQDFSCKVCDMRFTTVEAVILHMPSHTDDERDIALKRKPKAYTCDICHRTLWSKRTFQTHKQWHEQKQFPCNQCDKKYATQTGLNYHMFLHTGERPFQCSFCDKCYKNKNDLRIHVRLHTGEYPYKCKFCPKAFRSPSSLIKHGDAHTEERPFKCSFCDQAFKRENTRANHERIHTNDKRFTCKYCNKGFIQKGACMKHEKWHENENRKNSTGGNTEGNVMENMEEENMEENDSRDTLEIPEPSESGDSMDSFQMNAMEDRDVKVVDVGDMSMQSQTSHGILAEPVDEANVTAPSSADNNIHITLL